jgi:hypothetical protein
VTTDGRLRPAGCPWRVPRRLPPRRRHSTPRRDRSPPASGTRPSSRARRSVRVAGRVLARGPTRGATCTRASGSSAGPTS